MKKSEKFHSFLVKSLLTITIFHVIIFFEGIRCFMLNKYFDKDMKKLGFLKRTVMLSLATLMISIVTFVSALTVGDVYTYKLDALKADKKADSVEVYKVGEVVDNSRKTAAISFITGAASAGVAASAETKFNKTKKRWFSEDEELERDE